MRYLFVKALGGLLYIFVALSTLIFLSAWTFNYWQAWVFLAVFMVSISAIFIYLAKKDPALLARRIKSGEKTRSQTIIRFLVNLVFTAVLVVSALDHRFAWSPISSTVVFAGDAFVLLGLLVIFLYSERTL